MAVLKAGCFLIDKNTNKLALIYRKKQKDYSFPKGHLEEGETLQQCAVRETAEEIKRIAIIQNQFEPILNDYITPKGKHCNCYLYFAIDGGVSNNASEEEHDILWIDIDEVQNTLTHQDLKDVWQKAYSTVTKIVNS